MNKEIEFLNQLKTLFGDPYEEGAWDKVDDAIKKDFTDWVEAYKQQTWVYPEEDQRWRAWQIYQQEYLKFIIEKRIRELETADNRRSGE